MQELEDATGINRVALTAFRPGKSSSREKLQWASNRVTTLPEDIAYSLFGLFDIQLPINYGEKKHNALGRLLQEIIAHSSDISCLDWVGKSSEFNSCLPVDITSYATPLSSLLSLSEEEIETLVSSMRASPVAQLASRQLRTSLDSLPVPRFSQRRLHLPCIVFAVTQVVPRPQHSSPEREKCFTYTVKASGVHDLLITTTDKSLRKATTRKQLLLVRPWDRNLSGLSDAADDDDEDDDNDDDDDDDVMMDDSRTASIFPSKESGNESVDSESDSQALRLLVRLGQPFRAFLLAQRPGGREFSRVASDHDIVAEVEDVTSVRKLMDVRTLEIM